MGQKGIPLKNLAILPQSINNREKNAKLVKHLKKI
jgi:hypothetical protein